MNWHSKSVKDRGGFWTDHLSETGQFIIAQGYDEWERTRGKPWTLFDCSKEVSWRNLGYFANITEAKKFVETLNLTNPISHIEQQTG